MSDPPPPTTTDEDAPPPPPAAAEDRKTLAALSHLSTSHTDEDTTKQKGVDQASLSAAISRLEVGTGKGGGEGEGGKERVKSAAEVRREEERRAAVEERGRRAKVRVDAGDVGLLVEELDMTKAKATELLKTWGGDAVTAMREFVKAGA